MKLELNQKHLEFYFRTFRFISVTFGVSEQAATAVRLLVQMHVALQVLVRSCSVDARLCRTQSLLQLQTQARNNLHLALQMQLFSCSFFKACSSQAVLLLQTETYVGNGNWEKSHSYMCCWHEFWGPSTSKKLHLYLGKRSRAMPRILDLIYNRGNHPLQFCFCVSCEWMWVYTRLPPTNIMEEGSSTEQSLCLYSPNA